MEKNQVNMLEKASNNLGQLLKVKITEGLSRTLLIVPSRVLARDQSASLEDWQKLAKTGESVWFYNGRDRKKTGKITASVAEWLRAWDTLTMFEAQCSA